MKKEKKIDLVNMYLLKFFCRPSTVKRTQMILTPPALLLGRQEGHSQGQGSPSREVILLWICTGERNWMFKLKIYKLFKVGTSEFFCFDLIFVGLFFPARRKICICPS